MPVVKITGQGLSAIALSVALLWGCLVKEQAVARHDRVERARVLRDLRELQHHNLPVSLPGHSAPRFQRTTAS